MYPLRFIPIYRHYLWGGRRLAEVLHKSFSEDTCAESWEIVDHNDVQSVVAFGELRGKTLSDLIKDHSLELVGPSVAAQISCESLPVQLRNRFPLLLKFLDAHQVLSVQVHPDDQFAASLSPPDLGKTEAWYVVHADPGARIYAGLKPGITREKFRSAIEDRCTEQVLHQFEPQKGDAVFIKAGTIHAIGAGLLIAEIQQSSDTTFRVFDWNRSDQSGQPRPLHIEQAIMATDFDLGPIDPVRLAATEMGNYSTLIQCDKFVMRRWSIENPGDEILIGGDDRFHLLAITSGSVIVENDPSEQILEIGQTVLLPASLGRTAINAKVPTEMLEIFVPN